MTKITSSLSISALLGLCLALALPAQAEVGGPETIIYRVPGVRDFGVDFQGVATCILCTNFSGATETIRFVARQSDSVSVSNSTVTIGHLETRTACTHFAACYVGNLNLATGALFQGTIAIAATSINMVCTAVTVNGADTIPTGVSLHMIRFNPVAGSQE